jgi:hypothetical protein
VRIFANIGKEPEDQAFLPLLINHNRLLTVFAHPDDETFGTGGTLARYAHQDVEVYLICATRGEVGEAPVLATCAVEKRSTRKPRKGSTLERGVVKHPPDSDRVTGWGR